jgi:hypothetical protein
VIRNDENRDMTEMEKFYLARIELLKRELADSQALVETLLSVLSTSPVVSVATGAHPEAYSVC